VDPRHRQFTWTTSFCAKCPTSAKRRNVLFSTMYQANLTCPGTRSPMSLWKKSLYMEKWHQDIVTGTDVCPCLLHAPLSSWQDKWTPAQGKDCKRWSHLCKCENVSVALKETWKSFSHEVESLLTGRVSCSSVIFKLPRFFSWTKHIDRYILLYSYVLLHVLNDRSLYSQKLFIIFQTTILL
jgi:hypothetical protein